MRKLNFEAPINPLSLGNVSLNFLRELYKKEGINLSLFPIGDQTDLSAYDKIDKKFKNWLASSVSERYKDFSSDDPTIKVWHINGSEKRIGSKQFLYTFYELDSPTEAEINIVKAQNHVFFSCSEAHEYFKDKGCQNTSYVPLGFDKDFGVLENVPKMEDTIHFSLIGKFERRKNTKALIQLWLNTFGNNSKYHLSCLVHNSFFKEEHMKQAIDQCLMGQNWNNISFLPYLETNSEVNQLMNSIDIDLSGLSNGEGWNLPSFNTTALGKWSVVSNCTSHKDWANEKNAILVDPEGKQPCYDNAFFKEGGQFNQGSYYRLSADKILDGFNRAVDACKNVNTEGLKLQKEFTYKKTIEKILEKIY